MTRGLALMLVVTSVGSAIASHFNATLHTPGHHRSAAPQPIPLSNASNNTIANVIAPGRHTPNTKSVQPTPISTITPMSSNNKPDGNGVAPPEPNKNSKAIGTNTIDNKITGCSILGRTWTSGIRYFSGQPGQRGSIYAECVGGKLICFKETLLRDHKREMAHQVPCEPKAIHRSQRELGIYVTRVDHRWPKGVICYQYDSVFTDDQKTVFLKAMDEYHQKTTIRFISLEQCDPTQQVCGGCKDFFKIVNQGQVNDCLATIGYTAGAVDMHLNFGLSCFTDKGDGHGAAVHELGHIAGLIHEHVHPQRQVVVLRDQVSRLGIDSNNYALVTDQSTMAYSLGSIMHYPSYAGLCLPKDKTIQYCDITQDVQDGCVVPTSDHCDATKDSTFGLSTELTASDVDAVARMYGTVRKPNAVATSTMPTPAPKPPSLR